MESSLSSFCFRTNSLLIITLRHISSSCCSDKALEAFKGLGAVLYAALPSQHTGSDRFGLPVLATDCPTFVKLLTYESKDCPDKSDTFLTFYV